jgi:hypothetical protein
LNNSPSRGSPFFKKRRKNSGAMVPLYLLYLINFLPNSKLSIQASRSAFYLIHGRLFWIDEVLAAIVTYLKY